MRALTLALASSLALVGAATAQVVGGGIFGGEYVLRGYNPATASDLITGAGGYIAGLDVQPVSAGAPSGQLIARTDTYGAYLWNGSQWKQLITNTSMASILSPANEGVSASGVYEIAAAPSNPAHLYMMYLGYMFSSTDRGTTWNYLSGFTPVSNTANDGYRGYGRKMAVDPANENIVVVGTPGSGVFKTTNGGTSWAALSGLATGATAGYLIAFKPGSAVTGGQTQGLDVFVEGTGLYRSTNAGGTLTLTTSTPTTGTHMVEEANGNVLLTAADGSTNLYEYTTAWATYATGSGTPVWSVAVDPSNASHIVAVAGNGNLSQTTTGANGTWTGFDTAMSFVASDYPWRAWALQGVAFMTAGDIAFSPTSAGTVILGDGTGVDTTTPPTTGSATYTWTSQSLGIEQLVALKVVAPPGGSPLMATYDRGLFQSTYPGNTPSRYSPTNAVNLIDTRDVNFAPTAPNYAVALFDQPYVPVELAGLSSNGGATFTPFASMAPRTTNSAGYGGSIATTDGQHIVWIPTDNGSNSNSPWWTQNGGASWTAITGLTSIPASGTTGWGDNYYLNHQTVTVDTVTANTFYLYNYIQGIVKCVITTTASCAETGSGPIGASSNFNSKLQAVPGKAGNLLFTAGYISGTQPTGNAFYRSTNAGVSFSAVAGVTDVIGFGFGKAKPGGTGDAAIFVAGWVAKANITGGYPPLCPASSCFGIFESDDNMATWQTLAQYPGGSIDTLENVAGDPDAYGVAYVALAGSGFQRLVSPSAQVPPSIYNISTGSPAATSATLTATTDQLAKGQLCYGPTTAYGICTTLEAAYATSHSFSLSGLTATTTYHYQITEADASGYSKTTSDKTFTTISLTNQITVDGTATAGTGTGGSATVSLTASHAGDLVRVWAMGNIGYCAASDTAGNSWVNDNHLVDSNGDNFWGFHSTNAAALSADSITVTCSGSLINLGAVAYSGVNTTSPFDSAGVSGSPDPITISTTNPHTLIEGVCGTGAGATPAAYSGYTSTLSVGYYIAEYLTTPTSAAVTNQSFGMSGAYAGTAHLCYVDALVSK